MFCIKKAFLELSQNSQENTCASVFFLMKLQAKACNFIKKETLAQVFSCEFWESFKNTFSYKTALSTFSYSGCFWNEETSSIHSLKKRKVLSIVFFMTMFDPKLC